MRVALIQPLASSEVPFPCLPTFQLGIGMLCLKDYLKAHGHTVRIFHLPWAQLQGMAHEEAFLKIEEFDPALAGVALNWLHFSVGALEAAGEIKRRLPRCRVVLGGQHASLFSQEILERHGRDLDAVLHGEAEITLLALARALEESGEIDPSIPGVMTLGAKGTAELSLPEVVKDLDSLPFFFADDLWPSFPTAFAGAPEEIRDNLSHFGLRAALDTVRGPCPLDCSYCIASRIGAIQGRCTLTAHSTDWLVEHIAQLVDRGISSITIQDPFFVLGDGPLVALAEGILRRDLHRGLQTFSIFVEPGSYSREALALLSRVAGRVLVEYGIETGSPRVAEAMGREKDYGRILESLIDAREAGVIPVTWWMVGLPEEGEAEVGETKAFIEATMREGALPAQVSPLVIFPHTRLAESCQDHGMELRLRSFDDFSRFSLQAINEMSHYPDLLTHFSSRQSMEDTLRYNGEIKELFKRLWPWVERRYQGTEAEGLVSYAGQVVNYRYY